MSDLTYRRISKALSGLLLYGFFVVWPILKFSEIGPEQISVLILGASFFSVIAGFNIMALDAEHSFNWSHEHHFWPVTLTNGERTGLFPEVMARRVGTEWEYRLPTRDDRDDQLDADAM